MAELEQDRKKVAEHLLRFLPASALIHRDYGGRKCIGVAVRERKGDYNYGVLGAGPQGRAVLGRGLHGLYTAGGHGWHGRMAIVLIRVSGWGGKLPLVLTP